MTDRQEWRDLRVENPDNPQQAVQPIYEYRSSDRAFRNAHSKRPLADGDHAHVYMVDGRRRKADKRYLIAANEHGWPDAPECFGCGERLYPVADDDATWVADPDVLVQHPHCCAEDVMKCRPHEDDPRRSDSESFFAYDDDEEYRSAIYMFHTTTDYIENLTEWRYRKELEELTDLYGKPEAA